MTRKFVGGVATAMFAIGILTGSAGTIALRDASVQQTDLAGVMADHMGAGAMGSMMSMMSGSMMSGSMMDANVPSMPMDPSDHGMHHASPSPATQ